MADINTKIIRVRKRLVYDFNAAIGHDIYTLECIFHVYKIYFDHVVTFVEGIKKGPAVMRSGAVMNTISKRNTPTLKPGIM